MFQVIRSTNRLARLEQRRFADLEFREREHLQEWIAHAPQSLSEDLLIIRKEFDAWADTRERLDLLALDREGRLVVIENKLDDSGRDVVWQGGTLWFLGCAWRRIECDEPSQFVTGALQAVVRSSRD